MISRQSICYRIFREVLRDSRDMVGDKLAVRVNPAIADLLHGEESELIAALEQLTGRQIVIYPDVAFHLEEVRIIEILKEEADA
jgi:ribonuclease G